MARVRVRIDDLERGDLPALSVKTGASCTHPVALVFRPEQRPWSPLGPRIEGVVPLEASRVRARRLLTRTGWVLLVVGAAALVAALTGAGSAIALFGVLAFVAYAVLVAAGELRWVGSRPAEHEDEIMLTRVHRAFARAVDEQYGR